MAWNPHQTHKGGPGRVCWSPNSSDFYFYLKLFWFLDWFFSWQCMPGSTVTFSWLSVNFQLTFSWLSIDFQQWLSVDDVCRVQQWLSKRWNGARPVHCYVPWYSNIFMTSLINYIIIIMGQFVFHVFDVWIAFSDLNKGNVTGNLVFRWQIDPKSTRCNWRYQFSGFWTTTEADI